MAGSILKLTVDRQGRTLVSFNGSVATMPDCFQSNTLSLQIQVVDPTGDFTTPYSVVDLAGFGLRASVGQTPTGSAGGPTPLALQDTFAWDDVNKWFTADLALNNGAIDGFIAAAASAQAYFELNLTSAGNRITLLQRTFTLRAVVDELTSNVPAPTDVYLTKAEILALLSAKLDKLMKSSGKIYGRELGVADDGTPTDAIDLL
jgi:hypothetical protein